MPKKKIQSSQFDVKKVEGFFQAVSTRINLGKLKKRRKRDGKWKDDDDKNNKQYYSQRYLFIHFLVLKTVFIFIFIFQI